MGELEVVNEKPLPTAVLKELLEGMEKDAELSFRATRTLEYLKNFVKRKGNEVEEIKKKLQELNILRLKEKQMVKIIDMNPSDAEELKALLVGENVTLKQEELNSIIECLK